MNVSTNAEESSLSTPLPRSLAIAVYVVLSMVILAGPSGNAFICYRLRRRRDLRKVPHYLLASLSLTGILASTRLRCSPIPSSVITENVKKILLLTWLVAFIITAVLFVLLRKETSVWYTWFPYNQAKSFRTEQGNVILIYLTTITQLDTLAILLVITTFFRVVKTLRASTIPQSTNAAIHERQEKQLTWVTYEISGTYILFRFPLLVCSIVAGNEQFQGQALNTSMLLTATMMYFPFVLNPVLHFKMLRARQPNRVGPVAAQALQE